MKYSICVPCSKVKPELLERCLDYIKLQSLPYQLVIVFDETSKHLIPMVQGFNKNVEVTIDVKKKTTLASARNRCIDLVKGEWIVWCDADDILLPTALLSLEYYLTNTSLDAICYSVINKSPKRLLAFRPDIYDIDEEPLHIVNLPHTVWSICMRTSILKDNNLKLPEDLYKFEDLYLTLLYFRHCHKVKVIQEALYRYFYYENSLLNSNTKDHDKGFLSMYQVYVRLLQEHKELPDIQPIMNIMLDKIRGYLQQLNVPVQEMIKYEKSHGI